MSIKQKFNDYFSLNDTDTDNEEEVVVEKPVKKEKKKAAESMSTPSYTYNEQKPVGGQNVVAINQSQAMKKPKIKIMEPRLYSDAQAIADVLLNNQSVVLNFRRMEKEQAKKMIDFLMGTTYAIKGDIQRLGDEIFMCTPQSFEVDGTDLQAIKNNDYSF
ncbi:cell division protein SepF [Alkalibacterium sp. MB6]|uniref:cell division protein SepF n=1 Tax=Alkalibacterium sp. MB6 TaxID=2081965 RepID=UPI00137A167E|nr:cell division protein SepF [Alkalibacterium sp. MB6]